MQETRAGIALEGVSKRFGKHEAVRDVSLSIREGEFFSLLGPSGCGKTTTLRMIAGFEVPDSGRIYLQGDDVTSLFSNRRPVNMVFQQYALFPHMSIYDNVAFGLKVKKVPRSEHAGRVKEMLRIVELEGLEKRKPRQLSGGQQQRVALARALVNSPAALLLDEPLGALDVKLRKQMQLELKAIQNDVGTTFVYVTHDQEEALAMSDRIAVMNEGQVEQIGSPREIYTRPQTAFVADFIGSLNVLELKLIQSELGLTFVHVTHDQEEAMTMADAIAVMNHGKIEQLGTPTDLYERPRTGFVAGFLGVSNLLDGTVTTAGSVRVDDVGELRVGAELPTAGTRVRIGVRPEQLRLDATGTNVIKGTIAERAYIGVATQYVVDTSAGKLTVFVQSSGTAVEGDNVTVSWDPDSTFVVEEDT